MIYVGVDPGLRSGAVGLIDHNCEFIDCFDIPADGKRVDVIALRDQIRLAVGGHDFQFCIELVNPMPGQGSVSTGGFMRAAGAIEAVALLEAVPVMLVSPRVWKGAMGLTNEKSDSLTMARQEFPDAQNKLERKKDNNRAEALLLSLYLWKCEYGRV